MRSDTRLGRFATEQVAFTADAFFAQYTAEVQAMCLRLRALALAVLPNMEEIVFVGWKNVSYGTGQSQADKDLWSCVSSRPSSFRGCQATR